MTSKPLVRGVLFFLLVCLLINFVPRIAFAGVNGSQVDVQNLEDRAFPVDSTVPSVPQGGYSWGGFAVTAILFIAILFGFSVVVKRINKNVTLISPWLKVLDKQQIGPGHFIYLVELAGRLQILGVTGHSMVKIGELEDPEQAGEILQDLAWRQEQIAPPWWGQFTNLLRNRGFFKELKQQDEGERW